MTHPMEELLSDSDLDPYLAWTNGNRGLAREIHDLNHLVRHAFQPSLQGLEFALAERMHAVLSEAYGDRWLEDIDLLLLPKRRRQVTEVRLRLAAEMGEPTMSRMVRELPFGFWVSFLSPEFGRLWDITLHRIVVAGDGTRADLARRLDRIIELRERTLRPGSVIVHLDLKELHADIVKLTRLLSPELAEFHQFLSGFPDAELEKRLDHAKRLARRSITRDA